MRFANYRVYSGLFSQSNMGVVTKMGFGLMPNPGDHESYVRFSRVLALHNGSRIIQLYAFQREEDLSQLVT